MQYLPDIFLHTCDEVDDDDDGDNNYHDHKTRSTKTFMAAAVAMRLAEEVVFPDLVPVPHLEHHVVRGGHRAREALVPGWLQRLGLDRRPFDLLARQANDDVRVARALLNTRGVKVRRFANMWLVAS